ncbi:MAG TPA: UDP-N-acetylmuramate--L-alanine ligase [Candidatus Binatia bacterium]|nr:UDP-N-acetylmuramate--L-alanine ligase [Candidatus Binatia bacterium]
MPEKKHHVHFVGIGGIGMSGIAEVLLNMGYVVSGSDLAESESTRRLTRLGAAIAIGHVPRNVGEGIDVVVISSAVKMSNPEVARARELRIPVIARAEMLAELMRMKLGIAVAGTHGKTTTTSFIAEVLARAGLDPTVVIGGKLRALGTNARLGQGKLLVAEADESDGSFLMLSPTVAVVTNIDPEHLDHFGTIEEVESAFLSFVHRVPFYGRAILCLDHPRVRAMLPNVRKPYVTYGTSPDADWVASNVVVDGLVTRFDVRNGDTDYGCVELQMPGRHYALNALAAAIAACEVGVSFATVREALAQFGGIHRRFEVLGEASNILVVDDYGHHPEEVRATLRAAREGFARRRLIVAFQPHRFSRTRDLFDDFLTAFDDADKLFLTEIYAAGEERIEGVSGELLFQALKRRGHLDVEYRPTREAIAAALLDALRPGDLLVVLGAGDITKTGEEVMQKLRIRGSGLRVV